MPIYHNIKTIFVRVPKTATTSICEKLYTADSFARYFNKGQLATASLAPIEETEKHETIRKIRDNTPHNCFKDYFKVAFVRNPWDWLVSYYSYFQTNDISKKSVLVNGRFQRGTNRFRDISFKQFLSTVEQRSEEYNINDDLSQLVYPLQPQCKYLIDDSGKIIVDFVGRYENLNNDWATLVDKLGINNPSRPMGLQRLNSTPDKDYRTYYEPNDIERVYKIYKKDVELFGYEF